MEDLKNKMLDNLEEFLLNFKKESKSEGPINAKLDELSSSGNLSDSTHTKSSTLVNFV